MFRDLVMNCRSYRRFYEDVALDNATLRELVDLARCSASPRNVQPLKYIISSSRANNALIFSCLQWAQVLQDWKGPIEGERPAGYIIVLGDKELAPAFGLGPGIVSQTILLGAVEKGLGGCMLASVDRMKLQQLLNIPPQYEIVLVIALGKPKEKVVLEEMLPSGNTAYWRDEKSVHHVPKRRLQDIIVAEL